MTREDLKKYKWNQEWIEGQKEYIERQQATINQLSKIISDMPHGSRQVYDNEAEKLSGLIDMFNELIKVVVDESEKQAKIVEQIRKLESPHDVILFKVYILGEKLTTVADEMNYDYKYMCSLHGIALNKFDNLDK